MENLPMLIFSTFRKYPVLTITKTSANHIFYIQMQYAIGDGNIVREA